MTESRQHADPDGDPLRTGEGDASGQPRRAGWIADLIPFGLALVLPALAFTLAAALVYPPAAQAMAPVALGLAFVGIGLVLAGIVVRRRV
jgi:hypothetical protein